MTLFGIADLRMTIVLTEAGGAEPGKISEDLGERC
jgi:hypothetical protein